METERKDNLFTWSTRDAVAAGCCGGSFLSFSACIRAFPKPFCNYSLSKNAPLNALTSVTQALKGSAPEMLLKFYRCFEHCKLNFTQFYHGGLEAEISQLWKSLNLIQ